MTDRTIRTVGFVGTGLMGAPIAGHILDAGYDLVVYNRHKERAQGLLDKGAKWAASPAEVAKAADVTFTMVGLPDDVEEVYLGSAGLLAAAPKGSWLIDLTTSRPELAQELSEAAEVSGVHSFDCPVSGGVSGAEKGDLTLMIGATEEEVAPVKALLETFGGKLFYFDRAGMGQRAKLCNQVSLASCMMGMADALSLAREGGLDEEEVLAMISCGMGASRALTDLGPKVIDGDWKPGFRADHMLKDLGLALEESENLDITLPGTETAATLYRMLVEIGGGRLGTQALGVLYQEEADAVAAGLDWSLLDREALEDDGHDHDHCGCDHDHDHGHCDHHGHGHHDHCHCDHDHDGEEAGL